MKRVTKIKRSPMIVQAIENEGCETIYWVATTAFIHYEDGEGSTDKKHQISTDGKFYRKAEGSGHPGAQVITTVSPIDFSIDNHYFEPIEETA
jgi:hypothetical protein